MPERAWPSPTAHWSLLVPLIKITQYPPDDRLVFSVPENPQGVKNAGEKEEEEHKRSEANGEHSHGIHDRSYGPHCLPPLKRAVSGWTGRKTVPETVVPFRNKTVDRNTRWLYI
jgi:hypothetical protein